LAVLWVTVMSVMPFFNDETVRLGAIVRERVSDERGWAGAGGCPLIRYWTEVALLVAPRRLGPPWPSSNVIGNAPYLVFWIDN